jgi:signal transduction histidine kinase
MLRGVIAARGGQPGLIEIAYTEERPPSDEGPFLKKERELIDSLAAMLRAYFGHLIAEEDLQKARQQLSRKTGESTEAQARIERYQVQLRRLASQLAAVEARERRAIAADLHDHIGQALAFIKMNVAQLQANATFCGFEDQIADTLVLINQTIRYTRDLTSQISPPVLYELGLSSALHWLGENTEIKHKVAVTIEAPKTHRRLADEISATVFKSVQELLTNVVKHAGARSALIRLEVSAAGLCVEVSDDGSGFQEEALHTPESLGDHFGLFSIREQIQYLGGKSEIVSSPGKGTRVTLRLPC